MHLNIDRTCELGSGFNYFPAPKSETTHSWYDDMIKGYLRNSATMQDYRDAFGQLGISPEHFLRIFDSKYYHVSDS
jgi:hypothetical protein